MQYDDVIKKQDGGRTPYWKCFLAISWRHIGWLMRNSEWRWRITCRYMSRDQNGNFCKLKMADGRHFENSFISISPPRIIRLRSNLVRRCKFPFRGWSFDKKIEIFLIQDGGRAPLKIVFWLYYWRHIGRLMRNSEQRWRITCRYRSHDQNGNFRKLKMGMAAMLKIVFRRFRHIRHSCKLSNLFQ